MNSLTITQTKANGIVEGPVSNLIITKLYNIGKDDDEHQTLTVGVDTTDENRPVSTVSGRIRVNSAFINQLEYLAVKFPDLEINADSTYIYFEDPEVERVLLAAGIGDGTGITASDAAGAQANKFTNLFKENTTITKFNEFKYFTKANQGSHYGLFCDATNLEEIDLSEATFIGGWLFRATSLKTLNAPNLQNINGQEAFCRCPKLTSVLNLGLISLLPKMTFYNCSVLSNVVLPESCIAILESCFGWTNGLSDINLQNVESFGPTAFYGSSLSNVSANNMLNAKTIGNLAFYDTKLFGVLNLPKLITIGNLAFNRCNLITGIECLGKISTIPNSSVFYGTGVTYAKLPYECTTIGSSAFEECSNLTSIKQYTDSIDNWVEGVEPTVGPLSRVTSFGKECFRHCTSLTLTQLDIQNATTIGNNAFDGTLLSGNIVLPQLSTLGSEAFYGTQITSIDLTGSSISSLSSGVFRNCSSLSKISIPTSVTYLDWYWGDGIANVVTLEGFDNCVSHGLYNWQLYNKTILNPIKTSLNSLPIMYLWSNNNNINYNLLYNPSTTSTMPGYCDNGYNHYTYFTARVTGGTSRVNISLLYFRDISSFGALTFYKCNINNLVINNITPPTLNYRTEDLYRYYTTQVWDNNIFPTGNSDQNNNVVIGTLWVPDSAVATYQADPLYSHLNIKGINTKTNGTDYDLPRYATYAAWKAAEEAAVAQGGHAVTGIIEEYM